MGGPGEKTQLGKILLRQNLLTPRQLEELLAGQGNDDARLGSAAVSSGVVDEVDTGVY